MSPSPVRYLSVKQFTERAPISESTVRRRLESGDIPSIQPGGHRKAILIPENALDSLLAASAQISGSAGEESEANQPANQADVPDSTSTPDYSSPPSRRRGPLPRWQRTSPQ